VAGGAPGRRYRRYLYDLRSPRADAAVQIRKTGKADRATVGEVNRPAARVRLRPARGWLASALDLPPATDRGILLPAWKVLRSLWRALPLVSYMSVPIKGSARCVCQATAAPNA
jgi:hypothetical protein